jgi:hypothetical protein
MHSLLTRLIPPIIIVITPPLRQGPSMRTMTAHAMSPAERAQLRELVDTMVSYGLSYTARSGTDARTGVFTTELVLDPGLDALARYEGLAAPPARRTLVPAMRQVVSHECVVEHIRRGDATRAARGAAAAVGAAEAVGGGEVAAAPAAPEQTARAAMHLRCPVLRILRRGRDAVHACGVPTRPFPPQAGAKLVEKYKGVAGARPQQKKRPGRHALLCACALARAALLAAACLTRARLLACAPRSASAPESAAFYKFHEGCVAERLLSAEALRACSRTQEQSADASASVPTGRYTNAVRKVVRMHELL